jgi:hypothetical protein
VKGRAAHPYIRVSRILFCKLLSFNGTSSTADSNVRETETPILADKVAIVV